MKAQFFDLDKGLVGALVGVLRSPGEAVANAISAESNVFGQPLRVFLVANFFFFLIGPSVGLLNFSLDSLSAIPYYADFVQAQTERLSLDAAVYRERFDISHRFRQPTFVLVISLPLAFCGMLVSRRLVFGQHYVAALLTLAWVLVALPLIQLATSFLRDLVPGEAPPIWAVFQITALVVALTWALYRIARDGYEQGRARAWVTTVTLFVAVVMLFSCYGHLVFWITVGLMEIGA